MKKLYEKKYEKYEGDKKYVGNMKIRTVIIESIRSIYRPWDLKKFRDHLLISGGGGKFAISRFRDIPETRHETCQKKLLLTAKRTIVVLSTRTIPLV